MGWRYIATNIESKYHDAADEWSIREFYDLSSGETAFTKEDQAPYGNSREELILDLERMLEAARAEEYLDLRENDPDYWEVVNNEVSN